MLSGTWCYSVAATCGVRHSARRSKLVSQPIAKAPHVSRDANPDCRSVTRVPPSTPSRSYVTVHGAPGFPAPSHVCTSLFGASISRNSPPWAYGSPRATPDARQRPPTRKSPDHSRVSNTPGRTHQEVISLEVRARNTRSGEAGITTLARSLPSGRSATARAPLSMLPMILLPIWLYTLERSARTDLLVVETGEHGQTNRQGYSGDAVRAIACSRRAGAGESAGPRVGSRIRSRQVPDRPADPSSAPGRPSCSRRRRRGVAHSRSGRRERRPH